VENEILDLALISGNAEGRSLSQTPVLREPLLFVTRQKHDGAGGPIALAEVLAEPLAMPGENDALRRIVEAEARRIDLPLTVAYEIASIPAIKDLAARGVANAVLPFGAVRREVESGWLVARPIPEPTLTRTLTLVRTNGRSVGRHERQLVRVLRECLAALRHQDGTEGGELLDPEGVRTA
jgi:LysR family nitrogen assimilation transcriptional regulator